MAAGFVLAWASYVVLQVSAVPDWLVRPLLRTSTSGRADAIVVLGAGYYEPCGLNLHALRRTLAGVQAYREGRAGVILFTGGRTENSGGKRVAHEMAELARALGVPSAAVLEEGEARNTFENALYSSPILRARSVARVLLVTDTMHMSRAEACFRHFGFAIERESVPQVCIHESNLGMLVQAFHEYVGWLYYAAKGYTALPGA